MAPPKGKPVVPVATPGKIDKKALIAQAMGAVNKKFGEGTVGTLKDKQEEFAIRYIKTRSENLNATLHGGLAEGKISEVYGPPDSGKTSIILDTIGYNMQINPDFYAGWFETEGHFDMDYAVKTFGIDPDRFTVWRMEDYGAERGLDVLETLLRSGAYNLICVNTVAGLTPKKEMDDAMEDMNIGLQARMMSKLMRKITAVAAKLRTHMAFVNQVRAAVGTYGTPDTPAGGKALAFWASQRISMRSGFMQDEDKKKGYDPEKFKKIDVAVKKNRCSSGSNPYKKSTYYVEYGVGIDTIGEIPELVVSMGIITLRGSWHYEYDEKGNVKILPNGDKAAWNGAGAFRTYLRNNADYAEYLRNLVGGSITVESMTEDEIEEAKKEQDELEEGLSDED